MWALPVPTEPVLPVYLLCISRVRNPAIRARLVELAPSVEEATDSYNSSAAAAELHALNPENFAPALAVDSQQLQATYTNRMAALESPGREIYDRILLSADRCPLCGHRPVTTIDHHLPKSIFSLLAVTPTNLIPACKDCNHAKGDSTPGAAESEPIHPYFDSLMGDTWLEAEVVEATPPLVTFRVNGPFGWPGLLRTRVRNHFIRFGLGRLYGAQAATELSLIEGSLAERFAIGGPDAVREHLSIEADSRGVHDRNSWQAALYKALHLSDWYCSGGFALDGGLPDL